MKTSIFDMNFTLPPMVEMVKEEKEMPSGSGRRCVSKWFSVLSC